MASQAVGRPNALAGIPGEMIGEFFGTMVLILFGDGVVAVFGLFGPSQGVGIGANTWPVIIFGWGFAVMLGIYVTGADQWRAPQSGCNFGAGCNRQASLEQGASLLGSTGSSAPSLPR